MSRHFFFLSVAFVVLSCGQRAEVTPERQAPPQPPRRPSVSQTLRDAESYFLQFVVRESRVNGVRRQSYLSTMVLPGNERTLRPEPRREIRFEMALLLNPNRSFEFTYNEFEGNQNVYSHPVIVGLWDIETQGRLVLPGVGYATRWRVGDEAAVRLVLEHNFKTAGIKNRAVILRYATETSAIRLR